MLHFQLSKSYRKNLPAFYGEIAASRATPATRGDWEVEIRSQLVATLAACLSRGLYFGPKTISPPPLKMIFFPPLATRHFLTPIVAFLP